MHEYARPHGLIRGVRDSEGTLVKKVEERTGGMMAPLVQMRSFHSVWTLARLLPIPFKSRGFLVLGPQVELGYLEAKRFL